MWPCGGRRHTISLPLNSPRRLPFLNRPSVFLENPRNSAKRSGGAAKARCQPVGTNWKTQRPLARETGGRTGWGEAPHDAGGGAPRQPFFAQRAASLPGPYKPPATMADSKNNARHRRRFKRRRCPGRKTAPCRGTRSCRCYATSKGAKGIKGKKGQSTKGTVSGRTAVVPVTQVQRRLTPTRHSNRSGRSRGR